MDQQQSNGQSANDQYPGARRGAAGKAFLVYLGSGSVVVAIVAYFIFHAMGC